MELRLGSVPLRVHPSFLFTALLLRAGDLTNPPRLLGWVVVVVVSVLVHELGHALAGRAFGLRPRIDLHGLGGTTSWAVTAEDLEARRGRLSPLRRVVVSLAGPVAGLAVGALVAVYLKLGPAPSSELAQAVLGFALEVNIGWSVFNLLPLLPLDGGQVLAATLDGATRGRGEVPARIVSIVLSAGLGLLAARAGSLWMAFLAVMFAVSNVQGLRSRRRLERDLPHAAAIQAAYVALERDDPATVVAVLEPLLPVDGASPELRATAVRLVAYARLLLGDWGSVMRHVEASPSALGAEELSRFERAARTLGHEDDAARIRAVLASLAPAADEPAPFRA